MNFHNTYNQIYMAGEHTSSLNYAACFDEILIVCDTKAT